MISRGRQPHSLARLTALAACAALVGLLAWQSAVATAADATRVVHFQGRAVQAPRSWPVLRLARHPGMCVRLDRRAVYLGTPAAEQRCPAGAMGRHRAILVDPAARARARGANSSALPIRPRPTVGASASAAGGAVFTGLGFDACSTPSSRAMAAWASSPYRGIGVYIGGANRACSQPNLTSAWTAAQTAAGWHLIPTYVGLQAPTSSCSSCAKLSSSLTTATAQGAASALDAVEQASAVGMGAGSPIYFDMESYSPGSSATAATLTFLSSWTTKLHSLGYLSGVYSSSASGIADVADAIGEGYDEPDALWIANWNGLQNTADPNVPASAWSLHQRLHQYRGGHDETYGGTTINIDNNYLDGPTVGTGTLATGSDDPTGALELTGSPSPGQVRIKGWALDPDAPTQTLAIRAYVGGQAETAGAIQYDLGEISNRPRSDVLAKYPTAGSRHGFDISFPTLKSGAQPVCVYALNTGLGADTLLGCETTSIPVAITLSNLHTTPNGVRVRIACAWPTGTACPGQLLLRTRVEIPVHTRRGRPPRTRVVTRGIARRGFQLSGERAHGFQLPLSAAGRSLLSQHGKLRAQLIAAIPGGRRVQTFGIFHRTP